jgi:putative YphP/YqiW family bacilliredoxin
MLTQRYPEQFIAPMREELTRVGFAELRTPEDVDQAVGRQGTTLVVVNSVCGCAAGKARPGIALSLRGDVRPDHLATVFAGGDIEATERARAYFAPYPPSSPSIALLRNGKVVYMMERRDIESQPAQAIAERLATVYKQHCTATQDTATANRATAARASEDRATEDTEDTENTENTENTEAAKA